MPDSEDKGKRVVKIRPEQTAAAVQLKAQVDAATERFNGYLAGLMLENGTTDGRWAFSADLTELVER